MNSETNRVVAIAGTLDYVRRSQIGWDGVGEILRRQTAGAAIVTRTFGDVEIWTQTLAIVDGQECTVLSAREQLALRHDFSYLQAEALRDRALIDVSTELLLFWDEQSRDIAAVIGFARKAGRPFAVYGLEGELLDTETTFERARIVEAETRAQWLRDSPRWLPPAVTAPAGTRF